MADLEMNKNHFKRSINSSLSRCARKGLEVWLGLQGGRVEDGLPLDEEEVGPQDPKLVNKHWSITRVHKIHTSPLHTKAKVSQQADSNAGRHRVKNSNLPPHTIGRFTKDILPLAFEVTGTLHPWEYPSNDSDVKGELFLAVKGLVKQGISTWLHKFAITAEGPWLLSLNNRTYPQLRRKSNLSSFSLGTWIISQASTAHSSRRQHMIFHILATANIDNNLQLDEWPVGALIISIQAAFLFWVHCALLYSTKGSFNPPRSKPGAFSKANWGLNVVSQKGTVTAVKHASVFLKRIQALKDQQWIDIYATALENHEMDDEVGSGGDGVRSGTSSKDELLDPLYDDIPA
ncbi:hypothetical protein BJV74DRAFT_799944 [Russula compacta]|nr:hypothetical protein BJV74DRAFT_799944 [Russula compacta]